MSRSAAIDGAAESAAVLADLARQVAAAAAERRPLRLCGAGTRQGGGPDVPGAPLVLAAYRGIACHQPSELVVTVRAGTPLAEVEAALAERGQRLGFEPPRAGPGSTIGGAIATGYSGPARPYLGALRDCMLGVRTLSAEGAVLRFGGEVMKNVAGYDIARLMVGAWGTLGPVVEASLRVAPAPEVERTAIWRLAPAAAHARMIALGRQPWPVTGACHDGELLRVRLAGTAAAVAAALAALAPEDVGDAAPFWASLRDRSLPLFSPGAPVWRVVVPPATPLLALDGDWLVDWGGAQRWLRSAAADETIRAAARAAGGYAEPLHSPRGPLDPSALPPALRALQQRVKRSFDPHDLFNRGLLPRAGAD